MKMKITKTYRIDMESVESLMDLKAKNGTSINEMVNQAIYEFLSRRPLEKVVGKLQKDSDFEKTPIKPSVGEPVIALLADSPMEVKKTEQPIRTLGQDLLGEGDPDEYKV
jgi:hypothetical protein